MPYTHGRPFSRADNIFPTVDDDSDLMTQGGLVDLLNTPVNVDEELLVADLRDPRKRASAYKQAGNAVNTNVARHALTHAANRNAQPESDLTLF